MEPSKAQGSMDPRTYAWNYFAVHAAQRMSVFQFFVTLATAIVGGAVLIAGSAHDRKWAALLFIMLPFLSYVFWCLDKRTASLIKNAERALKDIEANNALASTIELDSTALFTNDDRLGSKVAGERQLSYSQSFRYVFIAAAVLGMIGAAIALVTDQAKADVPPAKDTDPKVIVVQSPQFAACHQEAHVVLPEGIPFDLRLSAELPSPTQGQANDD